MSTTSLLLKETWLTPDEVRVNPIDWTIAAWGRALTNKMLIPLEIHIGSDSQRTRKRKLAIATVIAVRTTRGTEYIYFKEIVSRKKFPEEGLWIMEEIQRTMEVAVDFQERLDYIPIHVDFDINPVQSELFISNRYKSLAIGWAKGAGFDTSQIHIKPDNQVATKAADSHARIKSKKGRIIERNFS